MAHDAGIRILAMKFAKEAFVKFSQPKALRLSPTQRKEILSKIWLDVCRKEFDSLKATNKSALALWTDPEFLSQLKAELGKYDLNKGAMRTLFV